MKKYLSILCILVMLSGMAGCSLSKNESKKNSTNMTSEETDYVTLDSIWECDYLKLSVNSNWESKHDIIGDIVCEMFYTSDKATAPSIYLYINHSDLWKKKTESESIDYWNQLKELAIDDGDSELEDENSEITSSFVKNGQAYIIVSEGNGFESVYFYANEIIGHFQFYKEQESLVLEMIDTIEFMPLS